MITLSAWQLGLVVLAVFAAGAAVAWMFFAERAFWLAKDYGYLLQRRLRKLEEALALLESASRSLCVDDFGDALTGARRRVAAVTEAMRAETQDVQTQDTRHEGRAK
jgi:hypothetical protein